MGKIFGLLILCALGAQKVNAGDEQSMKGWAEVDIDGDTCSFQECEIGDCLLDAYIEHNIGAFKTETQAKNAENTADQLGADATIAMLQSGAILTGINKGKITVGQLLKVFPDHDKIEMGKVQMKGIDILKAIEHGVAEYNTRTPKDEFLQVSGLKFGIDFSKPSGSRVKYIKARNVINRNVLNTNDNPEQNNDYPELDRDALYSVILSKHMWDGRDGFVFDKKQIFQPCQKNLFDFAKEKMLESYKPISSNTDGRIELTHTNELVAVENAQVIGTAEEDIKGDKCSVEECEIGDFLLDAYIDHNTKLFYDHVIVRKQHTTWTDASIAILPSSAIHGDFIMGEITVGQLSKVLPENNIMGKVLMSGEDIINAINHAVKNYKKTVGEFLQVSGLEFKINQNAKGEYSVNEIMAKSVKSNEANTVIIPYLNYNVILSKRMWNGGDGFVFNKTVEFKQFKKSLFDVAKEKIINSQSPIHPTTDGRILF